eukprot:Pgem_evm1s8059
MNGLMLMTILVISTLLLLEPPLSHAHIIQVREADVSVDNDYNKDLNSLPGDQHIARPLEADIKGSIVNENDIDNSGRNEGSSGPVIHVNGQYCNKDRFIGGMPCKRNSECCSDKCKKIIIVGLFTKQGTCTGSTDPNII